MSYFLNESTRLLKINPIKEWNNVDPKEYKKK